MTGDAGEEQQDDDSETIEKVIDTRNSKKGGDPLFFALPTLSVDVVSVPSLR